jgi:ESCRT-II complex subunit VPS22
LLGFGDFYYELAVQIVEICYQTRNQNGGLIDLNDLKQRLESIRPKAQSGKDISE